MPTAGSAQATLAAGSSGGRWRPSCARCWCGCATAGSRVAAPFAAAAARRRRRPTRREGSGGAAGAEAEACARRAELARGSTGLWRAAPPPRRTTRLEASSARSRCWGAPSTSRGPATPCSPSQPPLPPPGDASAAPTAPPRTSARGAARRPSSRATPPPCPTPPPPPPTPRPPRWRPWRACSRSPFVSLPASPPTTSHSSSTRPSPPATCMRHFLDTS
mmetsp:Transcript_436/g.1351  ORF Transcript_436/g.1351 Transcript_436/m.1351 type:complete len:219 (+) Transcript_436:1209-1865(+)